MTAALTPQENPFDPTYHPFTLQPPLTTNPDTDGDGVKDGEENYLNGGSYYFKNPTHWYQDLDGDGLINALDPDSDGAGRTAGSDGRVEGEAVDKDNMWDGWEYNNSLNPLVDDKTGNPDGDGLSNREEFNQGENSTYPHNPDTDGDDVPDGMETYTVANYPGYDFSTETNVYWYQDMDGAGETKSFDCRMTRRVVKDGLINALDRDSDGDDLNDYQELKGYQVTVYQRLDGGGVGEKMVNVTYRSTTLSSNDTTRRGLDPTDPLNTLLDSDSDAIPDYKEKNPRTYYGSYLSGMSTRDIEAQFNPLVAETLPPRIENLKIQQDYHYKTVGIGPLRVTYLEHVFMNIEADIIDFSGVKYVWVDIEDRRAKFFEGDGEVEYHLEINDRSLNVLRYVSAWTFLSGKFSVNISTIDGAGNSIYSEHKENGLLMTMVNQFLKAMGPIWDAAVKMAMKYAGVIYGRIVEQMEDKIKEIFKPIWDGYEDWILDICTVMDRIIIFGDTDDIDVDLLYTTLFIGLFLTSIEIAAFTVIYIVEPLVILLETLSGGGSIVDFLAKIALDSIIEGIKLGCKLAINIAIATILAMIGEVISALIPHDNPVLSIESAIGTTIISLVAIAIGNYITNEGLSKGDKLGLSLTIIGFFLSLAGTLFSEKISNDYAQYFSVFGAIIAGIGLVISLSSPDMPGLVGFLDEGIQSVMVGWSVYDAING